MTLNYSVPAVDQHPWVPQKQLTTVQAALGTDKSETTVQALTATGISRYKVPTLVSAISLRFITGADANADVLNVYALRNSLDGVDGHYEKVCGITLTGGKQVIGSEVFSDTAVVVASSEVWPTALAFSSQADDGVAKLSLNTHGYKEFLFAASTLADSLTVEVAVI